MKIVIELIVLFTSKSGENMNKNEMGFGKQITLLAIGISLMVFLCSVSVAVFKIRNIITTTSEQKIAEITEIAYNIMENYKDKVDKGILTEQQAKALALDDLNHFRYQGNNYIWIMDYDCIYLGHPTRKPGFDGKSLKDDTGRRYIQELGEYAKSGKLVFVKNFAKKPGDKSERNYPKVSVGRGFDAWKWIVATGVYVDEINTLTVQTLWSIFIVNLVIVVLILLGINYLFIKRIVASMNQITSGLKSASGQVTETSHQLDEVSYELAEGSNKQAAAIQETCATIEETASMVRQNNDNTGHAAVLAKNVKDETEIINKETHQMMLTMSELEVSAQEISKIIKTIDEIAFQTNILSLNAAVEAARAGEAGKGFAVVAEEVRTLAQRSAQSAKDTEKIIEKNIDLSKQGAAMAKNVESKLTKIDSAVKNVSDLIEEISAATAEQSQGIEQISLAISQMEQVLQQNASTAENTSLSSQELLNQTALLNEIVENLSSIINGHKSTSITLID